jgi:hypothetical protein
LSPHHLRKFWRIFWALAGLFSGQDQRRCWTHCPHAQQRTFRDSSAVLPPGVEPGEVVVEDAGGAELVELALPGAGPLLPGAEPPLGLLEEPEVWERRDQLMREVYDAEVIGGVSSYTPLQKGVWLTR